ncbi:MAG: 23S rRNA (uracil(1939)-C(5))-methyltransferase RlmD [Firmicutes bacterium HGW-Firmicutes-15]|nr:MAG: 23S rRNA (uracil(1939)-C(5))-methyltransferase RlmD [Firmicutes bacterium HGW-Firmicutes-15]
MRCYIDGITHIGEGVARIEGKATFIPYAIPGETVEVEITEEKKRFRRARLTEIKDSSEDRITPLCPHFYECGGCAYQHVSYPKQLELKQRVVQESINRIGKIDLEVNPVLGMEEPWRYRNKVAWHVDRINGQLKMGYYQNDSHKIIDITTCKLISVEMENLSLYIKAKLDELNLPDHGEIVIRQSSLNRKLMLVFRGDGMENVSINSLLDYPELESIYTINNDFYTLLHGEPYLEEEINGLHYDISALSFFQVNSGQTSKLYDLVKEYAHARPSNRVLDAYCGMGSISLLLAKTARKVLGVESYAPAIKDATNNKYKNKIFNCDFLTGPCEIIIPQLIDEFDLVVLDPPRAGCTEDLIEAIAAISPRRIVYVSCNPATLARDLALFEKEGFETREIQPVDMFPQTSHVECVVRIYRKEKTASTTVYE